MKSNHIQWIHHRTTEHYTFLLHLKTISLTLVTFRRAKVNEKYQMLTHTHTYKYIYIYIYIQCNPDIRKVFSGPKLKPVLPKQNRPNPDIKETRSRQLSYIRVEIFSFLKFYYVSDYVCMNTMNRENEVQQRIK